MNAMSVHKLVRWLLVILVGLLWLLIAGPASSHCDTAGGPIIPEAKAALEKGDVTPVLKWVTRDREAELKSAFVRAVSVRGMGPEARELADRHFLETLVRLHRAGEGEPYSGIKEGEPDAVVVLADKALAGGSPDAMIREIGEHMAKVMREKFVRAVAAAKRKNESVEAGREFVSAYVDFLHYVERVHAAIAAEHGPHGGMPDGAGGHSE